MAAEGAKLATGWLELTVSTSGAQRVITDEVGRGGEEGGKRAAGGILGAMKGIAGPLAGIVGAGAIVGYFGDAIGAASDFQESAAAIGTVFGDQAGAIQDFAAKGATAFGQTTNDVLAAAQTFGVYGKAAGLAGGDLTGFSQELVGLSTDLASFYNTDPSQAMEALAAGLRGESEPLRKYGVLLDDATLKSRAMQLGIYDGNGALTSQQKILASQAEIMAQTSDAQGDFERTSGGLANQQRILAAGWGNLQASIGALLLPALTSIVTMVNESIMPALQGFADGIGPIFAGIGEGVGPLADVFGPILSAIGEAFGPVAAQIAPLVGQFLELVMAVSPLGIVFQAILPVLPIIANLLGTLAGVLAGALGQAFTVLTPLIQQVATILAGVLTQAITALLPIITMLVEVFSGILAAVLPALLPLLTLLGDTFSIVLGAVAPLIPMILGLLTPILGLLEPIGMLVGALLPPLIGLFVAILEPILGLISPLIDLLMPALEVVIGVLSFLITIVAEVLTWLVELITGTGDAGDQMMDVFSGVLDFFGGVGQFFADLWNNIVKGFAVGALQIISFFANLPSQIGGFFAGIGNWLYNAGVNLIRGLFNGIRSLAGQIGSFFLSILPGWIVGPFKAALGIRSPSSVFAGFGENTVAGFVEGIMDNRSAAVAAMAAITSTASAADVSPSLAVTGTGTGVGGLGAGGSLTIKQDIHPREEMSEENIGDIALNKILFALRR
jgi:hypothetical protein